MQATVRTVNSESKVTKSGKTYYWIQVEDEGGTSRLSVFQKFNIGDVIEYEEGNLPGWPRNVRLVDPGRVEPPPRPTSGKFGRAEYTNLLKAIVAIAELAGITDHQAIAALNNTLLISLQRQGVKIDIGGFTGVPF